MKNEGLTRWMCQTLIQMDEFPSLVGAVFASPRNRRAEVLEQWLKEQANVALYTIGLSGKIRFDYTLVYALLESLDYALLVQLIDNHINETPEAE